MPTFAPLRFFIVFVLLAAVGSGIALGQSFGTLSGQLLDAETGEAIVAAGVVLVEVRDGRLTDEEGRFAFEALPPGTYSLYVQAEGYRNDTLRNLAVQPGKATQVSFKVLPVGATLETTEVRATRATVESSELSLVASMQLSEKVEVGITKEQIARSQDRDAAQVVRRLPGLSLADQRFVMVRGLSPRYSPVLLNGSFTPSFEPDLRAFSFDVLPSGLINEITVTKTPAPDLPGDFAGGVIQIRTLDVPARNVFSLGWQVGFREGTTFQDFKVDPSDASLDVLGDGSADRELPGSFPTFDLNTPGVTAADRAAYGQQLGNTWAPAQGTAAPEQRFNLLFARLITAGKVQLATTTALRYTYGNQYFQADRLVYQALDSATNTQDTIFSYSDAQFERSYRLAALHNWTARLNERHSLFFYSLFSQDGRSEVTERTGFNIDNDQEVQNTAQRYRSRRLLSLNLRGVHSLLARQKLKLDWVAGAAFSWYNEPDFRQMRYERESGSGLPFSFPVSGSDLGTGGRFYATLTENTQTGQVNLRYVFRDKDSLRAPLDLRAGLFAERRSRDFSARLFSVGQANSSSFNPSLSFLPIDQIFAPTNFSAPTGFVLEELTKPSDAYTASNTLLAGYLALSLPLSNRLAFYGGLRGEFNQQLLESAAGANGVATRVDNPIFSPLPSASFTLKVSGSQQLRLAYGMTVNRPELREIAPFAYLDFFQNFVLFGNDSLKTPTIHNLDLRWELYPNPGEVLTLGAFGKRFIDPIEWFFRPGVTSGGTRNYEFNNAAGAWAAGAEIEFRKSLASFLSTPFFRDLAVIANAAYIYTRVDLGSAGDIRAENPERPVQGQAPYVVNLALNYTNARAGVEGSLGYNVFGPRLVVVGVTGNPDIYERPRHMLDFGLSKRLGKAWKLSLGVQNLLDAAWRQVQDTDADGRLSDPDVDIETYRVGRLYSLGISYTLE